MAADMVPEMLNSIEQEMEKKIRNDKEIQELNKKLREAGANYEDANRYAIRLGELLSKTFGQKINVEMLPDGKMYFNIADRVVGSMLDKVYNLSAEYSQKVQTNINSKAGYGFQGVPGVPELDRKKGFLNKLAEADSFEDVEWMLGEPVVNYSQAAVDDCIKANVEYQGNTGIKGYVERELEAGERTCEWCIALAGRYEYPNVPKEVYQRHERCRCTVSYVPAQNNKRINVWTKR